MAYQETFQVETSGRGFIELTPYVVDVISHADVVIGLCQVFIHHTSASLLFCENADPSVRYDLENFMSRLVVDGDAHYTHVLEGEDDMPAHIRNALTQTGLTVPITQGKLVLGAWQGIFLWEHRKAPHLRTVTVTIIT